MSDKLKRIAKIVFVFFPLCVWEAYFFLLTKLYESSKFVDDRIDRPLNNFLRK